LVQVNVVARDSKGMVANLQKEDFLILDRGVRQRIAGFTVMAPSLLSRHNARSRRTQSHLDHGLLTFFSGGFRQGHEQREHCDLPGGRP